MKALKERKPVGDVIPGTQNYVEIGIIKRDKREINRYRIKKKGREANLGRVPHPGWAESRSRLGRALDPGWAKFPNSLTQLGWNSLIRFRVGWLPTDLNGPRYLNPACRDRKSVV